MEKLISKLGIVLSFFLISQFPNYAISDSGARQSIDKLLEKKRWAEAIPLLRIELKENPKSIQNVIDLSVALSNTGGREEALNILLQAGKNSPSEEKEYFIRRVKVLSRLFLTSQASQIYQDGMSLLAEKKFHSATEKFKKALLLEPDNVELITRCGQSLYFETEYKEALKHFRNACQLNPYQPEIRLWFGRALFHESKFKEAIAELNTAVSELKTLELPVLWYSEALLSSGQGSAAIRVLEQDVKHFPLHVLSLVNLAKFRLQIFTSDSRDSRLLWSARKELQLAMSRLEEYFKIQQKEVEFIESSAYLGVDLMKNAEVTKNDIIRLQQQIDARLNQDQIH